MLQAISDFIVFNKESLVLGAVIGLIFMGLDILGGYIKKRFIK